MGLSGAGTGVLCTLLGVVGVAPWWVVRRLVHVRADVVGRDGAGPPGGPGSGRTAGGRRRPRSPSPAPGGAELTVVLTMLAAACRSGAALPRALAAVGEALADSEGAALVRVGRALVLGASWGAAWELAAGSGAPDPAPDAAPDAVPEVAPDARRRLDVVRDALAPTWERGAPPGPALVAATEAVRRDARARAGLGAGRLGVRLVLPLGLCFLPAFVLVGLVPVLVSYGAGLAGGL